MKKLKFMKGVSYRPKRFTRDEEISLLNQEIVSLKKRIDDIEIKSFEEPQIQSTEKPDALSKSLDVIKNIGNLKISESDSTTYEKEKSFEAEDEMEMEMEE